MIYNPEKIKELTKEYDTPICYINGNYEQLIHTVKNEYSKEFKFYAQDIGKLEYSGVNWWMLFFKKRKEQLRYNPGDTYVYFNNPSSYILEKQDLEDFYLILKCEKETVIFYNLNLIHSFSSKKILLYDIYNFDINQVYFKVAYSKGYRYYEFKNGKEKKVDIDKLSLCEWDKMFFEGRLAAYYSEKNRNPFNSPKLKWNDEKKVKWVCTNFPQKHVWSARIADITSKMHLGEIIEPDCPLCIAEKKERERFNENPDSKEFKLKINKSKKYVMSLYRKYIKGVYLLEKTKNWPDYITFYYLYPDGKHGDINYYLAKTYGEEIKHIENIKYSVEFNTKHMKHLLCLQPFKSFCLNEYDKWMEKKNEKFNNFFRSICVAYVAYNEIHKQNVYGNVAGKIDKEVYDTIGILSPWHSVLGKKRDELYSFLLKNNLVSEIKWKNEYVLFNMVLTLFPDAIFQYKAKWLEKQSIDIFIPSKQLAIEYQGEQHYNAISFFGDEEGLKHTQERDARKLEKCKKENVELIYWKYDEEITQKNVEFKFSKWLD